MRARYWTVLRPMMEYSVGRFETFPLVSGAPEGIRTPLTNDGIPASMRILQDMAPACLSRSSCHPDVGQSWRIHGRLYRESGGFKMRAFRARGAEQVQTEGSAARWL